MSVIRIGLDLAKNVFQAHGVDEHGTVVVRKQLRRREVPRIGGFQSFHTARRTIRGFEAMLWLRKGFAFAGSWTVCEQNQLLALCFGLPQVIKE